MNQTNDTNIYQWLFCPFYHRRGTVPCPHSAAAAAPVGLRRVLPGTGRRTIRGEKMVKHGGNMLENGMNMVGKWWKMVWTVETCWEKKNDELLMIFSDWTSHDFFAGPCGFLPAFTTQQVIRCREGLRIPGWSVGYRWMSYLLGKNYIKYKVKSILSRSLQILHKINNIWLQKG